MFNLIKRCPDTGGRSNLVCCGLTFTLAHRIMLFRRRLEGPSAKLRADAESDLTYPSEDEARSMRQSRNSAHAVPVRTASFR